MARHNREGQGEDQRGRSYTIGYQPDWLYQVKVARELETGRRSTKTLFRNPEPPEARPGSKVRTQIRSEEMGLNFEITVDDPDGVVRRVTVETVVPSGEDRGESVEFVVSRRRRLFQHGA